MIDTVFALAGNFDLLIIDDGSPDGTGALIKEKQVQYPDKLFLVERAGKLGLGTAYICGFEWGLQRNYKYLFEMDCDFSHNPKDLPRLLEAAKGNGVGMSVGSRYIPGGRLENWPLDRKLLSIGASLYVRLLTWMPVKDPTAGFVCYRREALERLDFRKIRFIGYAFQIEMKFATRQLGFQIKEVPITFTDRLEGQSKMSKGIVKEAIWGVIQMRWRSFFDTYARVEEVL